MDWNRSINARHVYGLKNSISKNNLSSANPIIVNDKFEIIDWQHRFEALRLLSKPIYYIVQPWLNMGDVQLLNSVAKNWTYEDYLKSYVSVGLPEYIKLHNFVIEYGLTVAIALSILGQNTMSNHRLEAIVRKDFINWSVSFSDEAYGEANFLMWLIKEMHSINKFTRLWKFIQTFASLTQKGLDPKRFLSKLKVNPTRLLHSSTSIEWYDNIEKVYNYKNSNPFHYDARVWWDRL